MAIGLVELLIRVIVLVILVVSIIGVMVLVDDDISDGKSTSISDFLKPSLWKILENRIGG